MQKTTDRCDDWAHEARMLRESNITDTSMRSLSGIAKTAIQFTLGKLDRQFNKNKF